MRARKQKVREVKGRLANILKNPDGPSFGVWGTGPVSEILIQRLGKKGLKRLRYFIESVPRTRSKFNRKIFSPKQVPRGDPCLILITSGFCDEILASDGAFRLYRRGFRFVKITRSQISDLFGVAQKISDDAASAKRSNHSALCVTTQNNASLIKFSVVIPTYQSDINFLRLAIKSVLANDYPYHEIIISDDNSSSTILATFLSEIAVSVPRVRVLKNKNEPGISGNTNTALQAVTGSYVVFLDHDDRIHSSAFATVAKFINHFPDKLYIYTDEDKLSEKGVRFDPYLKSDLDPLKLMVLNCVSHLSIVRTDAVKEVGYLDTKYNGSQDWALAVKTLLRYGIGAFLHLPEVLYHWRTVPKSAAGNVNAKPWARIAGRALVSDLILSRFPAMTVRDHPRNSFNRLVAKRHAVNFYGLMLTSAAADEVGSVLSEFELNDLRLQERYFKKLENSPSKIISDAQTDLEFLREVIEDPELDDNSFILILPARCDSLDSKLMWELYTVCLLSGSGLATGKLIQESVDRTPLLFEKDSTSASSGRGKPSWELDLQQSCRRAFLDLVVVSVAKARHNNVMKHIGIVDRRIMQLNDKYPFDFAYTPFAQDNTTEKRV